VSVFGAPVATDQCPCGSGHAYDACCGALHRGEREAETAVELMRSRYAAYVLGDEAYLLRTWHPRTRPRDLGLGLAGTPRWLGLTVLATADGNEGDPAGEVEFEARHVGGVLHERSRFTRRAGHWVYVDGTVEETDGGA
jgi:SEC-C motif-containing protein